MKFLTAAQLDELADLARAFEIVMLAAYEDSGHGWRAPPGRPPGRLDRVCISCGEPTPCPVFAGVMAAIVAVRDALVGLGVWEEVLSDADARHAPPRPPHGGAPDPGSVVP